MKTKIFSSGLFDLEQRQEASLKQKGFVTEPLSYSQIISRAAIRRLRDQ
jgi:hypothetical protein